MKKTSHITFIVAIIIGLLSLVSSTVYAEKDYGFFAETTLYDTAFSVDENTDKWPSMQQSLELTTNFYQLSHYYLQELVENKSSKIIISTVFDLFVSSPYIWLHEEQHRAVMSRRGIDSHNESYFFYSKGSKGVVKVDEVKDEELRLFKKEHPAEFVNMHISGIVSQTLLNRYVEHRTFFHKTKSYDYGLLWANALGAQLYMNGCNAGKSDTDLNELELKETNIADRDFTGMDCRAWVYDLFRPNEPYEDRGTHITGNGYDRYIKYNELTSAEKSYLDDATKMQMLNFIDPNLFGIHHIKIGNAEFNFASRHFMAPFGQMTTLDFYLKLPNEQNYTMAIFKTSNKSHTGYGIEAGLYRYPIAQLLLTSKFSIMEQPKDLSFYTNMEIVTNIELGVAKPVFDNLEVYATMNKKSDGWVPGTVYLEGALTASLGINVKF